MLRKIVLLIGSLVCSAVVLAEDAPLPFDDPAAAPPIVRKASPSKVNSPVMTSQSHAKFATKSSGKQTAKSSKYKSASSTKKSAHKSSNKAAKPAKSVKKPQTTTSSKTTKTKSSSKSRKH